MIVLRVVDGVSCRLHIERVGFPPHRVPEMSIDDQLLLIVAAEALAGPPSGQSVSEPTAEEMLAIGMALGMYGAERAHRAQPGFSAWRLAARLGL